jgi:hypothetical protein
MVTSVPYAAESRLSVAVCEGGISGRPAPRFAWISTPFWRKVSPSMEAAAIRATTNRRAWVRVTTAACLSAASAFAYLAYLANLTQGIIVGALLDLPGREQEVAIAQHRATYWFMASLFCQTGSMVIIALLLPFASDESPSVRFIVRIVLAVVFSLLLTLLIGVVTFSMVTGLHRFLVR